MELRRLGDTDVMVSALCLGTMTWGQMNTPEEGFAQMDAALDLGINFFDTAEMYPVPPNAETYGRTEEILGDWIKARGSRDKFVLATKVSGPGRQPHIRDGARLTRASVLAACDTSLKRLKTDVIDLYQIHWPDRTVNVFGRLGIDRILDEPDTVPLLETLSAMGELVKQGKIRHIGLSNETPWGVMKSFELAAKHGFPKPASIQNVYNLLNRNYEIGLSEVSLREGIGLLPYSPLAMGVLSGKYLGGARPEGARITRFPAYVRYLTPRGIEATQAYVDLARKHGIDPCQMAIAWATARPFVTSTIIGQTSVEQLKTDVGAMDLTLSEELLAGIEAIHAANANPCP
jgi:aryl-alcohol dehydrogenase-like predicted oxidoreductase